MKIRGKLLVLLLLVIALVPLGGIVGVHRVLMGIGARHLAATARQKRTEEAEDYLRAAVEEYRRMTRQYQRTIGTILAAQAYAPQEDDITLVVIKAL